METLKQDIVKELNGIFSNVRSVVLADFRGLNVASLTVLRRHCKASSVNFRVVKNTLAKIASKDTPIEKLVEYFKGPVSIAISYDDDLMPAKVLVDYANKDSNLRVLGGLIGGKVINAEEVALCSKLSSKEVLLSKMLATIKSPISGFVQVMGGVLREFIYALEAIKVKKSGN